MSIFKTFESIVAGINYSDIKSYMQKYNKLSDSDIILHQLIFDIKRSFSVKRSISLIQKVEGLSNYEEEIKPVLDPIFEKIGYDGTGSISDFLKDNWRDYQRTNSGRDVEKRYNVRLVHFLDRQINRFLDSEVSNAPKGEAQNNLVHVYDELFGGKRRIVLPAPSKMSWVECSLQRQDRDMIFQFNFFMDEVILPAFLIGNKKDAELEYIEQQKEAGTWKTQNFYFDGKYVMGSAKNRELKTGKMLDWCINKEGVLDSVSKQKAIDYMKLFTKRFNPKDSDKFVIVISRHPYDIVGMSTGRGWRSCMNIIDGCNRHFVESIVLSGALIAYLCREDDTTNISGHKNKKINIQKPIGRVLIKPYYKDSDGAIDFQNPNYLLLCSKTYHYFPKEAVTIVQDWIDENWNNKVFEDGKSYKLGKGLYKDYPQDHFYSRWQKHENEDEPIE